MKMDLKRYLKSKLTILILLSSAILFIISIIFLNSELNEFRILIDSGSSDISISNIKKILENYRATNFIGQFFYNSEFYHIYIFMHLIFIGVFLSSEGLNRLSSGYGNFLQTRFNYKNHISKLLLSQSLYILIIQSIIFIIFLIISLAISNFKLGIMTIGDMNLSFAPAILIIIFQFLITSLFLILCNIISFSVYSFTNNTYLIQSIPLVFITLLPILLGSTLGNLNKFFGVFFTILIPFESLYFIKDYILGSKSLNSLFYMLIMILTAIILYKYNVEKFSKDYIQ